MSYLKIDAFLGSQPNYHKNIHSKGHWWFQGFEPLTIEYKVNAATMTCFPFSKDIMIPMVVNLAKCF